MQKDTFFTSFNEVFLLSCILIAFLLFSAGFNSLDREYGWDEAVFYSQVRKDVPNLKWHESRSKGLSWLIIPSAIDKDGPESIRWYLLFLNTIFFIILIWVYQKLLGSWIYLFGFIYSCHYLSICYSSEIVGNYLFASLFTISVGSILLYKRNSNDNYLLLASIAGILAMNIRFGDGIIPYFFLTGLFFVKSLKTANFSFKGFDFKILSTYLLILFIGSLSFILQSFEFDGLADSLLVTYEQKSSFASPINNLKLLFENYSKERDFSDIDNLIGIAFFIIFFLAFLYKSLRNEDKVSKELYLWYFAPYIISFCITYGILLHYVEPRHMPMLTIAILIPFSQLLKETFTKKSSINYLSKLLLILLLSTYLWNNFSISRNFLKSHPNSVQENISKKISEIPTFKRNESVVIVDRAVNPAGVQVWLKTKVIDLRSARKDCEIFEKHDNIIFAGRSSRLRNYIKCNYNLNVYTSDRFTIYSYKK